MCAPVFSRHSVDWLIDGSPNLVVVVVTVLFYFVDL